MIIGGLDLGTGSCKLSVHEDGKPLAEASASYAARRSGGRHTMNPDLVWGAVKRVFADVVREAPRAAELAAVAVSAFGEAAIPLDAAGAVLGDSLLFWDDSGREEAAALTDRLGQEHVERLTGVSPHSMFTVCKMAWQKRHADYFPRVRYFTLFEDFIIFRLTGERLVSYSLAGRTMGLDIEKKNWAGEVFAALDLDVGMMSRPAASGTVAGVVLPEIAAELGLNRGMAVTTGGHDQMCVAVGAGAITPGVAANGSGTVEVMSGTLLPDADRGPLYTDNYCCSVHADPARYFTYSFASTGSILLNWFADAFAGGGESLAELERRAPSRPTDLLVVPYFAGTGTPFMNFDAKGHFFGMTLETTRYDIYRALLEGLTLDLALNVRRLEADGMPVAEIRAAGGGAASDLWLQIKADVTGRRIARLANRQAGTLGCIMLASVAKGLYPDIYAAAGDMVAVTGHFEPDAENHAIYLEKLREFENRYAMIQDAEHQKKED